MYHFHTREYYSAIKMEYRCVYTDLENIVVGEKSHFQRPCMIYLMYYAFCYEKANHTDRRKISGYQRLARGTLMVIMLDIFICCIYSNIYSHTYRNVDLHTYICLHRYLYSQHNYFRTFNHTNTCYIHIHTYV